MSQTLAAAKRSLEETDINDIADAKKPRLDEDGNSEGEQGEESVPLEQDEVYWFDDGNIVLVVGNLAFKVYKGPLTDHSVVFSDMFSFPQPSPSDSFTPSECPYVYLNDDPGDLRHLFEALYPRKETLFLDAHFRAPSIQTLLAYARLGHKYQMDDLLRQALKFLKMHFPSDLDGWLSQGSLSGLGTQIISVVNIARLCGYLSILPTAFMACCQLQPRLLVHGFQRADGSIEQLSHEDLARCMHGKGALMRSSATIALSALKPSANKWCESDDCRKALQDILHASLDEDHSAVTTVDPFYDWGQIWGDPLLEEGVICGQCWKAAREGFRAQQSDAWIELPGMFYMSLKNWG